MDLALHFSKTMQDHKLFSFICYILLIMPCGWSSNSSKLNPIEQIWCELNCHVWCRTLKSYHSDKPCRSGTTFIRLQSWCQWDVIYNHLQSVNNTNGGHTSYWLFVNIFWPWTLKLWFCYSSFCTIALSNGIMPTHVLIECEIFIILIFLI